MFKPLFRLPLLLALFAGPCWGAAVDTLDLSEPAIQINSQGNTVVLDISYRVPVSPREAWAVLTDFENMPGFIPNLESSKVLQRNGRTIQVEQKGSMRLGMLPIQYESIRQVDVVPYQSIRSHTLSGNTRLESVMALTPTGEGTLLAYHATAVSDLPVPNSLVTSYLGGMLESQFKAMRNEMVRRAQLDSDADDDESPQLAQQPVQAISQQASGNSTVKTHPKPAIKQSKIAPKKIRMQTKKRPG